MMSLDKQSDMMKSKAITARPSAFWRALVPVIGFVASYVVLSRGVPAPLPAGISFAVAWALGAIFSPSARGNLKRYMLLGWAAVCAVMFVDFVFAHYF